MAEKNRYLGSGQGLVENTDLSKETLPPSKITALAYLKTQGIVYRTWVRAYV
jgi:hypothetical protein